MDCKYRLNVCVCQSSSRLECSSSCCAGGGGCIMMYFFLFLSFLVVRVRMFYVIMLRGKYTMN